MKGFHKSFPLIWMWLATYSATIPATGTDVSPSALPLPSHSTCACVTNAKCLHSQQPQCRHTGFADALFSGVIAPTGHNRSLASSFLGLIDMAAREGQPAAMEAMGEICMLRGDGFAAAGWLELAAISGRSQAMFALSELYAEGKGREMNPETAAHWLMEAAAAGHAEAQMRAADFAAETGDERKASFWVHRAASQGHAAAQYSYGCRMAEGKGVGKNVTGAIEWMSRAAEQNHEGAMMRVSEMLRTIDPRRSAEWLVKAASLGEGHAIMSLALAYQVGGMGVPLDPSRAIELYGVAAKKGDARGYFNVGVCYLYGRGVSADEVKGAQYIVLAAEMGLPEAYYVLGTLHMRGVGSLARDTPTAFRWFRKAADADNALGVEALIECFKHGVGTAKNEELADKYAAFLEDLKKRQQNAEGDVKLTTPLETLVGENFGQEDVVDLGDANKRGKWYAQSEDFTFESSQEDQELQFANDREPAYNEVEHDLLLLPSRRRNRRVIPMEEPAPDPM